MPVAEIALVLSALSFVISIANLIWNIWSKFIFPKPRVRVTASVQQVHMQDGTVSEPFISMVAINYGPGDLIIHLPIAVGPRDWRGRREHMLLRPLKFEPSGMFDPNGIDLEFPRKLAVGESTRVQFPIVQFATKTMTKIERLGFVDTFNRSHWVKRRETKKLRAMCAAAVGSDRT